MDVRRRLRTVAAWGLAATWAVWPGCGKTLRVTEYPEFDAPGVKRVAVLPLANETLRAPAGRFCAQKLAAALADNGAYEVVGPRQVAALLKARGVALDALADDAAIAKAVGELPDIDAFITGKVTTFAAASYAYRWSDRGYGYAHYTYGPDWYYPIQFYARNEAVVAAQARLVRVADAEVLTATRGEARATVFSQGDPPHLTPDECSAKAAEKVADQLVRRFAPVRRTVRVSPDQALRTARGKDGGRWAFTDTFDAERDTVHVLLSLPPEADLNRFAIELSREGDSRVLARREFVWTARDAVREFTFDPRELLGGREEAELTITFVGEDGRPVFSREITVR
jgi:curli biogenesis system outer membrane secretion channel CsgG